MSVNRILQRNLLALSSTDPKLTAYLGHLTPEKKIEFITSRSGAIVPIRKLKDRKVPLHSTIDPVREGKKFLSIYTKSGYLLFLGFGAGYHIDPFLSRKNVNHIIIIEKDPDVLRLILERIDLRSILMDNRVHIFINESEDALRDHIISTYFPAIDGDLNVIPLRSCIEAEKTYYNSIMESIKDAIGKIADDYTVQAHFGKKWFVNTLLNLPRAEKTTLSIGPSRKIIVTGAGPSLEEQIGDIVKLQSEALLIATDTSLPCLLANRIKPDLVISIDCQHITYHHFLQGYPEDVPLVLDLATPPLLTRLTPKTIFFSSGHPFSLYVTSRFRKFPFIDTSGGNVSQAALSLADSLGAEEIFLFGVDFSYPEGKSYSRGTYLYHLFRSQENRLSPLESLFASFIFRNSTIIKINLGSFNRYTTQPMISYKERMEEAIGGISASVVQFPGKGERIKIVPGNAENARSNKSKISKGFFAGGVPKTDWKSFLNDYLCRIRELPEPYSPISQYLLDRTLEEREVWMTQYPAATALRESKVNLASELDDRFTGAALLSKAKAWNTQCAAKILEQHQGYTMPAYPTNDSAG